MNIKKIIENSYRIINSNLSLQFPNAFSGGGRASKKWSDDWPSDMTDYGDVYERISLVRQCINLISDFSISTGWLIETDYEDLKKEIEEMENRTNFSEVLKKAIKKREIWGFVAFEIVKDKNGYITDFNPLNSRKLKIVVDKKTMRIKEFKYRMAHVEKILNPENVFYLTKDSLDCSHMGISALESIKTSVNTKWQLEKDLLEASMRLWSPYVLFRYDSSMIKDQNAVKKEMKHFADQIKPGKAIVHNKLIESNVIDMHPNINSLIEAIRNCEQEIMGNWGIPRALLSREKTASKASLEFSVKAMYEGTVRSVQQYLGFEIRKQIYNQISKNLGHPDNSAKIKFKPPKFHDSPLIRAFLYGVKEGAISPKQMFDMLNWPIEFEGEKPDDKAEPSERLPPGDRPVTMQEIENLLDEKIEELKIRDD